MKTITYNPATHKLVPLKPTEEMIRASCLAQHINPEGITYEAWEAGRSSAIALEIRRINVADYKAMLAAAPEVEGVSAEPVAWIDSRCLRKLQCFDATVYAKGGFDFAIPLYAAPQPTDDYLHKLALDWQIKEAENIKLRAALKLAKVAP